MRGVFGDEEIEEARPTRDTELTLGSGTLLAIFFGLVLLCGLCFGMGYAVGHHTSGPLSITAPQPAPDQEPLQASGAIPKPSAIAQTPVAPPADAATDGSAGTAPDAAGATAQAMSGATAPAGAAASQPEVKPALPVAGAQPNSAGTAQAVRPALAQPQQTYMVQIAAVSNPEDADVLVNALKKRNYPVTAHKDPGDDFIHVRIGPFATHDIANQWRMKLLNDGYNALIQP